MQKKGTFDRKKRIQKGKRYEILHTLRTRSSARRGVLHTLWSEAGSTDSDPGTISADDPTSSTENPTTPADDPTTGGYFGDDSTAVSDDPTTGTANPTTSADDPTTGGYFGDESATVSDDPAAVPADDSPTPDDPTSCGSSNRSTQDKRSLLKFILLSLVTFGIYSIVVMSSISTDINTIASRYDGKKTMHYCLVLFVLSGLTLGIFPLIWNHQLSERIGNELTRRGIDFQFGAKTFWLWGVLGSFILVGPFIYTHKLLQSMNLLCEDYNVRG